MSQSAKSFFDRLRSEDPDYREAWEKVEDAVVLAGNIIRLRREQDLTQKDLARRAGMRQPRIAELETGEANPTLETLKRVAGALGTKAYRLLEHGSPRPTIVRQYLMVEARTAGRSRYQDPLLQQFYPSTSRGGYADGWSEIEEIFE